jgi:LacI family transcriptional regulator
MKVARQKGLDIPNDLQVIGFTDGVLSKHAFPPLTTVSQHGFEMGQEAAKLLIDRLETDEDEAFKTTVVKTDIVYRDTTTLQNLKI